MLIHSSLIDTNTCGFLIKIAQSKHNLCSENSALILNRTYKENLQRSNFDTDTLSGAVDLAVACSEKFFAELDISNDTKRKVISDLFNSAVAQIESMDCSGQDSLSTNYTYHSF